jgi:hypothetical protein
MRLGISGCRSIPNSAILAGQKVDSEPGPSSDVHSDGPRLGERSEKCKITFP